MRRGLSRLAPVGFALALAGAFALYYVRDFAELGWDVRFAVPWALALLPLALASFAGWWRLHRTAPRMVFPRLADLRAVARIGWARWLALLPALRFVAIVLGVLALARPQSANVRESADVEGIDIVFALDLSNSMRATDLVPNRLDAAKSVLDDFVRRRRNDRLGLVVFGREAYTLCPLTLDYSLLRNLLTGVGFDLIDGRGTAIGNAIGVGLNRLRRSPAKSKVVILLTDGDSNSGNITPAQAAEFASTLGVRVYAVLMGEPQTQSAPAVPDLFGRAPGDQGRFPVRPEVLRDVAQKTGAEFYLATDRAGLDRSFHAILDRLERTKVEDAGVVYAELFPRFLLPAFALVLLELFLRWTRLRRFP